jgi:hypothetical protein
MSALNSLPSLRRPTMSTPLPIGRSWGADAKLWRIAS